MTKADVLARLAGRDYIADLHLVATHDYTIDQQLHQLPFLLERGGGQTGLHPLAERFHRGRQPGCFAPAVRLGLQLLLLPDERRQPFFQLRSSPLVFGQRHDAAQIRFGEAVDLLPETGLPTTHVLSPCLDLLR